MSFEVRETRVVVCDGCDYDIAKDERYTTLELTYSFGRPHHGKIPLHFHELNSTHDCLRYFFTGYGIMERVLNRYLVPNGLLPENHLEFILKNLRVTKVAASNDRF